MKPIKAKPIFYAVCYEALKTIAKEYGFNLLIDGSLNRDLDLVLIPWISKHDQAINVVEAFRNYLGGKFLVEQDDRVITEMHGAAGRKKCIINLNRESRFDIWGDEEWYLDITIIQP